MSEICIGFLKLPVGIEMEPWIEIGQCKKVQTISLFWIRSLLAPSLKVLFLWSQKLLTL